MTPWGRQFAGCMVALWGGLALLGLPGLVAAAWLALFQVEPLAARLAVGSAATVVLAFLIAAGFAIAQEEDKPR